MTVLTRLGRTLATLLLAWQAVVAQAHLHVGAPAPTAWSAPAASSGVPQRPDTPYDCPVCREIAHAGQYLTPAPVLLGPPVAHVLWSPAAVLVAQPGAERSHGWRSRAPPTSLHA